VHSDMLTQFDGRPEQLVPDKGQLGFSALYRLYDTASGWLFLGVVQEKEWEALTKALEHTEWLSDDRYASREARLAHGEELAGELAALLASRPAAEWERDLVAQGVPAATADEQSFEHFLVANVPHRPMTHPDFGDYWRRTAAIRIDGCVEASPTVAPALGEHTMALLAELGIDGDKARELVEAGVVKASAERLAT